jgi:hypothetical protein
MEFDSFDEEINILAAVGGAVAIMLFFQMIATRERNGRRRGTTRRRQRTSMHSIFDQMGERCFRRAYRMTFVTFWDLFDILQPNIIEFSKKHRSSRSNWRTGPNGKIPPSVRLGCAIRYFAGGSPYDIMTAMGIGRSEVFKSLWVVVESINKCPELDICFPTDHNEQRQIAIDFKAKSSAGFDCCVGAVDGILIWIDRPSEKDSNVSGCDPTKFFCGRKHKFGLNCQAICDAKGKFLDISILFPGSTSDILSFESSNMFQRLQDGLLAPRLCLFGDNAYINSPFMATPYSGVSGGTMVFRL